MDIRHGFRRMLKRQKVDKDADVVVAKAKTELEGGNVQTGPLQTSPEQGTSPPPVVAASTSPAISTPSSNSTSNTLASQQYINATISPLLISKDRQSTDSTNRSSALDGVTPDEPAALPPQHSTTVDHREATGQDTTLATTQPAVIVQHPTPPLSHDQLRPPVPSPSSHLNEVADANDNGGSAPSSSAKASSSITESPTSELPPPADSIPAEQGSPRRQTLVSSDNLPLLTSILGPEQTTAPVPLASPSSASQTSSRPIAAMMQRKIWVKRPGQSATLVAIQEDDLVDDVRDKILRKYANSLGRSFDSPDVVLRIVARQEGPRSAPAERLLGPEEEMCKTLDQYYHGGQTVGDALIIDIPPRRTPRPSPRGHHGHGSQGHIPYHALEDYRPQESGTDYFPPMPAVIAPVGPQNGFGHDPRSIPTHMLHLPDHPARSISVLQTGQVPPLPSPGAAARRHRPKYGRQHTSSPTIISHSTNSGAVAVNSPGPGQHLSLRGRPRHDSNGSERPNGIPAPPPLPTPPAPEAPPTNKGSTPPTPLPRDHHRPRPRKSRKITPTSGTSTVKPGNSIAASLLDGSVPPINVLIVEDNIINLKLLEAFMKRLKVRWSTAMNGQIAVNKWRQGGFHLVLMDIQLPIMSGLEATKEIRRLERVNGIGVFSNSAPTTPMGKTNGDSSDTDLAVKPVAEPSDPAKDRLSLTEGLFKSPVIIVALTASSLQSDRHEALAAGCNDFLTKPVNFVWMERKVKEWGCMQALIDYDGWRQWKDFSSTGNEVVAGKGGGKAGSVKSPVLEGNGLRKEEIAAKAREKKIKRDKRASSDFGGLGAGTAVGRKISLGDGSDAADEAS